MILTCNSCDKKFVVPDSAITASGRTVQCGSCGNKWKQYPINKIKDTQTSRGLGDVYERQRFYLIGRLAQLVEHLVYTERVIGSSPLPPTIK